MKQTYMLNHQKVNTKNSVKVCNYNFVARDQIQNQQCDCSKNTCSMLKC